MAVKDELLLTAPKLALLERREKAKKLFIDSKEPTILYFTLRTDI